MGKPKAPDPIKTGEMQTSTNIGTAIANSYLGNINQKTPDGSLTYDQTGTTKWIDPVSKKEYNIPTFTATQTLSDMQQKIKDQSDGASLNLAELAKNQSSRLDGLLSKPFSLDGAPSGGDASGLTMPNYSQFAGGPNLQTSLGDAGAITRSYGSDYSSNVKEVQDALMARQNPYLDQDRSALQQQLADQGLQVGSAAYNSAMADHNRQRNDARYGAILNAGQEQSRLAGLDRDRAMFENSAQGQAYQQLLSSGQFGNQAKQQMGDNAYRTTAGNNMLQDQGFNAQLSKLNAQDADRSTWMNEQFALRNQPLNEISALLSGGQVTNPNFITTQGQKIATTDYAGLINQDYQNKSANWQSGVGGLLGLGSAFLMSDERTKTDVEKVGKVKGHNVYSFRYKFQDPRTAKTVGVMAQEVERKRPDAVKDIGGIKHVNYGKLFELGREAA
jgi:hypothetical protein